MGDSSSVLDELTGAQPQAAPLRPAAGPAQARTMPSQPPAAAASGKSAGKPPMLRNPVSPGLMDRLNGAVAALGYVDPRMANKTVAITVALEALLADVEAAYNNGQPFPWQSGRGLHPGRRVGQ
jgi:hypothetical protein